MAILQRLRGNEPRRRGPVISTDGQVGISGFSKLKGRLDEQIVEVLAGSEAARTLVGDAVAPWVVHDLRRSLASCRAMGVQLAVTGPSSATSPAAARASSAAAPAT